MKQLDAVLALCAAISGKGLDYYYTSPNDALVSVVEAWQTVYARHEHDDISTGDFRDFTETLMPARDAMFSGNVRYTMKTPYTAEDYAAATAAVTDTPVESEISTAAAVIAAAWANSFHDNSGFYVAYALQAFFESVCNDCEIEFTDDTVNFY